MSFQKRLYKHHDVAMGHKWVSLGNDPNQINEKLKTEPKKIKKSEMENGKQKLKIKNKNKNRMSDKNWK